MVDLRKLRKTNLYQEKVDMRIRAVLILLSAFAISCGLSKHPRPLSEVYVFNEEHNEVIVNRVQEYGNGTLNGCVVPGMIRLDIKSYTGKIISGSIKAVRDLEGIPFGQLKVMASDKTVTASFSDINGNFVLAVEEGDYLVITDFGFETLTIEWDELLEIIEESV